jgi:hypothetical protein
MAPNTSRILANALNPPERSRLRAKDRDALAEVLAEEEARATLNSRFPVEFSRPEYRHVDRPHWSTRLPDEIDSKLRAAIPTRYDVWVFDRKGGTKLRSSHRVGPKKLFDLKYTARPTPEQIEYADSESLRCAQRAAYEALIEGADRVEIRTYRRKESSSRFSVGPVLHGLVRTVAGTAAATSILDSWIDGEPTEKSLSIDAMYGV